MQKLFIFSLIAFLSGCSSTSKELNNSEVTSFYDYQLASPSGDFISLNSLPAELANADVILVGEWHTHSGIHRFQTDLLKATIQSGQSVALSMEQFSRDSQATLNQYLSSEIGEQTLMKEAAAWPNYESDYRPLVELAKANQLDIVASNAPKPLVRCIGRNGLEYLDRINKEEREWLADDINTSASPYKEKFMASMHHGSPDQTKKQFEAQITWDETMAESITQYLRQQPDTQVIHVAGKFHTEGGLGTAQSILRRSPNLKVVIVTPTDEITSSSTDYQLKVLAPPARYVKKENRMNAYHALSKRNNDLTCK